MVICRQINKPISVIEFPKYYEQASRNGGAVLIQEYKVIFVLYWLSISNEFSIKKLSNESKSLQASLGLTVEAGTKSNNTKKNRFLNIVPCKLFVISVMDIWLIKLIKIE